MIPSKARDWSKIEDKWLIPSEESYYYAYRWKQHGFKRILDLGCGLGRHSIFFAENGFEVDAFDFSEDALVSLRERIKDSNLSIRVLFGDMINLPYHDASFDCLFAYNVIYHTDTLGIRKVIGEINRVLINGGEFFITLISKKSSPFLDCQNKVDDNTIIKTEYPERDMPHYYTDNDDLKELLGMFEILKIRLFVDVNLNKDWHYHIHGKKNH